MEWTVTSSFNSLECGVQAELWLCRELQMCQAKSSFIITVKEIFDMYYLSRAGSHDKDGNGE